MDAAWSDGFIVLQTTWRGVTGSLLYAGLGKATGAFAGLKSERTSPWGMKQRLYRLSEWSLRPRQPNFASRAPHRMTPCTTPILAPSHQPSLICTSGIPSLNAPTTCMQALVLVLFLLLRHCVKLLGLQSLTLSTSFPITSIIARKYETGNRTVGPHGWRRCHS